MKYIRRVLLFGLILIAVGFTKSNATTGTIIFDGGVRMRKSPSTDADIVTYLNKSAQVEILEETNGWYKVKYTATGNYSGYIRADMIQKEGQPAPTPNVPSPTPTPTPTPASTTPATPTPDTTPTTQPEDITKKSDLIGDKKLSNNANIYILPLITSSIKGTVNKGSIVSVLEVAGNFAYIKYSGQTGWIRISNIDADGNSTTYTSWTGYVNIEEANVREQATTSSKKVTSFKRNTAITIVGEEGDFYIITVGNVQGYMAKYLISNTVTTTNRGTERTSTPAPTQTVTKQSETIQNDTQIATVSATSSAAGDKIAQMAKSFVGYKYVYGGASPSVGFDCSGLVYYIFRQCGYSVHRTATDQRYNDGVDISKSQLQPGDLVFFTNYQTNTGIGHVGIYIGNNQFVHASTPSVGVIISSLTSAEYTRRYVCAKRVV